MNYYLHVNADSNRGQILFAECAACHSVLKGDNGVGPSLYGVFGRKAGTLDNFRYSAALKRSRIVWTAKTVKLFITDPQKLVRGNRMPYSGMFESKDREDLIQYLLKL